MSRFRVDLSFKDNYDREIQTHGRVRQGMVPHFNHAVVEAFRATDAYDEEQRLRAESAAELRSMESDDDAIHAAGFDPKDRNRVPGYVERHIDARHFSYGDAKDEIHDAYASLYDAAYHVRSVLSERTLAALGEDYIAYEASREAAEEKEKAARGYSSNTVHMGLNGSRLFLVDSRGVVDPFSFDEPNDSEDDQFGDFGE